MPVVLKKLKLTYLEIEVNQYGSRELMSHLPRSRRECGYRGRKTLEDKGSAEQTVALLRRGGERGEISLLSDTGGPFWIRTIKYRNLSLSKFNEDKQFTCFEGPMPVLQGPQGAHPRLHTGSNLGSREAPQN